MATLEYRFTKSTPVLRDLARTRSVATSPLFTSSSERTEKANPFEFIDSSLGLLADLQKTQDNDLRREFEQQRDFGHTGDRTTITRVNRSSQFRGDLIEEIARRLGASNGYSSKAKKHLQRKRARKDNKNSTTIRLWISGPG